MEQPEQNAGAPRRTGALLLGLIPVVYAVAFLTMTYLRERQGHRNEVHLSEIESLAIRTDPVDPLAEARARGAEVFQHYCRLCHGEAGKGDGQNSSRLAETMGVRPQDFTDPTFWHRRETTEDRLRDAVAAGGPINGKSVLMPAWGNTLTDKQIRDVIVFIRSLANRAEPQTE